MRICATQQSTVAALWSTRYTLPVWCVLIAFRQTRTRKCLSGCLQSNLRQHLHMEPQFRGGPAHSNFPSNYLLIMQCRWRWGDGGGVTVRARPHVGWSLWTYRHHSFTEINEKRRRYKPETTEAPSRFDEYLVFPGVNNHSSDGGCGRGDGSSNFWVAFTKPST